MKTVHAGFALILGAVLAVGSARAAMIQNISQPLQYGSQNTYFAYAEFVDVIPSDNTWDAAAALAAALPTYNGLSAHLAVFQTQDVYNWMAANYSSFVGNTPGDWDQAYVGAVNNAGTYEWLGGMGTIPSDSPNWNTNWNPLPQPNAANHGVVWMFGDYGNVLTTQEASGTMGNVIIQYGYATPVPEPTTGLMLVLGASVVALARRRRAGLTQS